ncbi:MAG: hypothetical protein AAF039_12845 [Bacteroidota bacterium]
MVLEENEVSELILSGVDERIELARKQAQRINMHITGQNTKDYLEKLDNYENHAQRQLKEKLLKTNKSLFSFLLRPVDQVFSANGGSIQYNLSETALASLKESTQDVNEGLSIKDFLRKKVFKNYIIDPNGFLMCDLDEFGGLSVNFYQTKEVFWYERNGNKIEALIFNPYRNESDKEDDKEYFRVIDDVSDNIYVKDGDTVTLSEDERLPNFFGFVPAHVVGDIYNINQPLFASFIEDVLDDAQERLRDVNTSVVHKLAHGYAKYWQYPEACTTCGGDGEIKYECSDTGDVKTSVCPTCDGSGVKSRKDASDLMLIDIPRDGEQKIAPDVGGYINPSIEIWKQYKEDIKDIGDYMYECLWGSYFSRDNQKEKTATESFTNTQIKNSRRQDLSKNFEKLHKFILDCYGKILFGINYESSVSYGTKYNDESPEVLLETIFKATEKNISSSIIGDLQIKYYQSEYANDQIELTKKIKLYKVDPFPTMTPLEVKSLGVDPIDFKCKVYYPQWVSSLDDAKIILSTTEELKNDLKQFVEQKQLEDGTGTQPVQKTGVQSI